ncbi:telomere repeats-binding bouquet formation protein 1 isoform X2 [Kryptolebias marmoratus]|uniref:Telomere repeat binding bouquet formation protein 1 n=1 Tax=Kryptolebias marmoratus TaxID=37003 RepID=A0A3Q3ALW3_KRYMA|nr:telomere repeats-binding bouquet formation protein 1 isoform X2 [Kryptolebias marmoratus]
MDRTSTRSNNRNTTKTDLSLLLECLKHQMKCPDTQKQALLTIHSICEKREDNVDLLRELGGVAFLYNLSKSSFVHSEVKEAALFTLGTLAEANVYCKNSLCRKEIFTDIAVLLRKEDVSLTQKRVSVYLLFVLVANNKSGQTLAKFTGCLEILLDLFRITFPLSKTDSFRTVSQSYELWASVSSALCGCVNNPQNEEGQSICVAAFPVLKVWLQQTSLHCTEVFQPICSFISMAVANNSCVQESFFACGCLETLTLALIRVASAADTSLLSCKLSIIIARTLSACITDNLLLASALGQYGIVPPLFSLLTSSHLDPEDRLPVLLCIGQCTGASEEHQTQLVQCGGLPVVITFLTEDTSEEVRKAAAFILQTCKQATMCLEMHGLIGNQAENEEPLANIEGVRDAAKEMLRRIEVLEQNQLKEAEDEQEYINASNSTEGRSPPSEFSFLLLPPQRREGIKAIQTQKPVQKSSGGIINLQTVASMTEKPNKSQMKEITSSLNPLAKKAKANRGDVMFSVNRGRGALVSSHVWPLESSSESQTADNQLFREPLPVWQRNTNENTRPDDVQDSELSQVEKIPEEEHSVSHIRCAGCVLPFEEVTSRTFASIQSSCSNSCDMHRVLREATERFRKRHLNFVLMKEHQQVVVEHRHTNSVRLSPAKSQRSCENWSGNDKGFLPQHSTWKHKGITLTPLCRRTEKEMLTSQSRTGISYWPSLTPLKRRHLREDGDDLERRGSNTVDDQSNMSTEPCSSVKRRKRQDFSREEICYLLSGVKKYGFSWNSILWSYPFQPGRTNVDLAKKYRRLTK